VLSSRPTDSRQFPSRIPVPSVSSRRRKFQDLARQSSLPRPVNFKVGKIDPRIQARSVLAKSAIRSTSTIPKKSVHWEQDGWTSVEVRYFVPTETLPVEFPDLWTKLSFRGHYSNWPHFRAPRSVNQVDGRTIMVRVDGRYKPPRKPGIFGEDAQDRPLRCPYCVSEEAAGGWVPEVNIFLGGEDFQAAHRRKSMMILCEECDGF